jgi:hypothetical protein
VAGKDTGNAPLTVSLNFLLVSFLEGQRSLTQFAVFYLFSLAFAVWGLWIAKGAVQKVLGMVLCGLLGAGALIMILSGIAAGK